MTTLRRLDGKLFEPVQRQGKRKMRVFTAEQVEVLREALRENTRLGLKPKLVGIEEVRGSSGVRRADHPEAARYRAPSWPEAHGGGARPVRLHPRGGEEDRRPGEEVLPEEDSTSSATGRKRAR